jgi:exonuclease SbcD
MVYRILHTADWHLGKSLNDQSREPEQELFLAWLLRQVVELKVDVVLVAGDIFDTANPPQSAEKLYFNFVADLNRQTSSSLVLVAGNHDSASQLDAPKRLLKALRTHVVGSMAEEPAARILCLPSEQQPKVAIAMVPFLRERDVRLARLGESNVEVQAQVREGIAAAYRKTADAIRAKPPGCPVIATGHLTVTGASTSDSERDIHIGGLGSIEPGVFSAEFAYVALGHLHRPQSPDGQGRVRYAGSPLPLSFSEVTDKKEVRILDIEGDVIRQFGVPVPTFRKLVRVNTTADTMRSDLTAAVEARPAAGELTAWVEVVVGGLNGAQDVADQARLNATGLPLEVLKVSLGDRPGRAGPGAGNKDDTQAIESMIDRPAEVFEHLLGQREDVSEKQKESLRLAFAQLVEKDAQTR